MPAVGALLAGAVSVWLAPETRGGGSDAIIEAFHYKQGRVRKRVAFVKAVVSILTLGSGGSGGREGPTMQMGGALGSLVGQVLRSTDRERRILLVAGTAAGMAAVFRTPLGAALLAVEILHRDDFEADAIVPSVLASVVSYSVFIAIFGERTLFSHAPSYPFVPQHLPLYALLALVVSFVASTFLSTLRWVQRMTAKVRVPDWCKPGLGGLALGVFATPMIVVIGPHLGQPGQGLGILGGGYGAAQLAITGADLVPPRVARRGALGDARGHQDRRHVPHRRQRRQRRGLRALAGHRRHLRRRVRPRRAPASCTTRASTQGVRARGHGNVLRGTGARSNRVTRHDLRARGKL